eukprot:TRINITY_DN9414_c0_g1_i1.p1 TRINITY_DN9414_c0_g1~~TRINITY_DN9414_c0_g1_i1.p1  ORF type:complete len:132 (-),score=16.16 TRINITY_DN9414_c0_g1_i1:28-423(-)
MGNNLSTRDRIKTIGVGVFFWAAGVPLLRLLSDHTMRQVFDIRMVAVYALQLPVAYLTLKSIKYILQPESQHQKESMVSVVCATACILEGLVLTFMPGYTYGNDPLLLSRIGATLLTGVGTLLGLVQFELD